MRYEAETFTEQTVDLDGNQYVRCRFENCALVFRRSDGVGLEGNVFNERCRWQLAGPAERTMQFLKGLYHGGAQDLVEGSL